MLQNSLVPDIQYSPQSFMDPEKGKSLVTDLFRETNEATLSIGASISQTSFLGTKRPSPELSTSSNRSQKRAKLTYL